MILRSSMYPAYMDSENKFGMGFYTEIYSLSSFSIFTWWGVVENHALEGHLYYGGPTDSSCDAQIVFYTLDNGKPRLSVNKGCDKSWARVFVFLPKLGNLARDTHFFWLHSQALGVISDHNQGNEHFRQDAFFTNCRHLFK